MTDVLNPYPKGWIAPQIVRISAALAAAGAWDGTPLEMICAGADVLTVNFTYTRGAANGAFDWQLEVSPYSIAALVPAGAAEWITESQLAVGVTAAGTDTTNLVQRDLQSYEATAAAAEDFVFGLIELRGTIERYRIRARESGVVGTPGTLQITGTPSRNT